MPKKKKSKRQKSGRVAKAVKKVGKKLTKTQNPKRISKKEKAESDTPKKHGGNNLIEITPYMIATAEKEAGLGLDTGQIAAILGMHERTLEKKSNENPDLATALRRGRAITVHNVASKLYEKIMKQDNLQAIMFYLRTKGGYSEKNEMEISGKGGGPIEMDNTWTITVVDSRPGSKNSPKTITVVDANKEEK